VKRVVELAPDAIQDQAEIHAYLLEREGRGRADAVLDGLEGLIQALDRLGDRGHAPPELEGLGQRRILEVHFKPYRVLYRLDPKRVTVLVVADGRRNFGALLRRRLLR
jgi:toxin ParE1/3/4